MWSDDTHPLCPDVCFHHAQAERAGLPSEPSIWEEAAAKRREQEKARRLAPPIGFYPLI